MTDENGAKSFGFGRDPARFGQEVINDVDRLRNRLRHLNERWKDRPSFDNSRLIEEYFSGGFSITLNFDATGAVIRNVEVSSGPNGASNLADPIVILVDYIEAGDRLGDKHWDQQSVFTAPVEFPEVPKQAVGAFVGADFIHDDSADARSGQLYGSIPALAESPLTDGHRLGAKGSYKPLFILVHGEGDPGVMPSENFGNGVVQGAPEIVGSIAKGQDEFGREWASRDHTQAFTNAISILLYHETAEVSLKEGVPGGMKLVDVLVGPYVL